LDGNSATFRQKCDQSAVRDTYQKKVEYTAKQIVPLVLDGVKIADIPVSELIAKW
jgi:hypothetical protein